MPVSSIAQILMRLAALNWMVAGLIQGVTLIPSEAFSIWSVVPSLMLVALGVALWMLAPLFARLAARGADHSVTLTGVSIYQLYLVAFVALGLYFALANFALVFNWIHFAVVYRSTEMKDFSSLYGLTQPLLTFAAGIVLVVTAPIWARKLAGIHQKAGD